MNNNLSLGTSTYGSRTSEVLWPSVLLFIYVLLPELLVVGIETILFVCLLLFVGIWWVASREKLPSDIPRFVGLLLLIVFVGLLGAEGHDGYDVAKDVWYVTNAALALLVGYVLMLNMNDLGRFLRVFIIVGTIIAMLYLRPFIFYPVLLKLDVDTLRRLSGGGSMTPCIALGVLMSARIGGIRLFEKNEWFFWFSSIACSLAVILSYSRTMLAVLLLILLTAFGWVSFASRGRVLVLLGALISVIAVGLSIPADEFGLTQTMINKILFSIQEIRIANYFSYASINEHWRGYETLRALYTYSLGTPWQYLVGGGFGTNVDLGLFMDLGGDRVRFAPILHNGYMYLLVKTGIVGLFLYLLLFYRMIRKGTLLSLSKEPEMKYCGRLIVGLVLAFIVTSAVVSGMFNKAGMLSTSLLLGALLAYGSMRHSGRSTA